MARSVNQCPDALAKRCKREFFMPKLFDQRLERSPTCDQREKVPSSKYVTFIYTLRNGSPMVTRSIDVSAFLLQCTLAK